MVWGALAMGAASIIGGMMSGSGSEKAGKEQAESSLEGARISSRTQLEMFEKGQAATAPWRATGQEALGSLGDIYGIRTPTAFDEETGEVTEWRDPDRGRALEQFQESPGYQFQLDEARKGSEYAASARGMSLSGSQVRRLQDISQGTANMEFNRYTQGLQSLAGVGQSSAGQTAGLATQTGANVGATMGAGYQAAGAATAQGIIGQSNAMASGIGQAAQAYGMYQGGYFNQPTYGGGSGATTYGGGTGAVTTAGGIA